MNTKYFRFLALLIFSFIFLNGCTQGKFSKSKDFKHPTPLIKDDIRKGYRIKLYYYKIQ